jgi:hypothetical protein
MCYSHEGRFGSEIRKSGFYGLSEIREFVGHMRFSSRSDVRGMSMPGYVMP